MSAVSVIPAVSFCVLKQSSDITPSFSLDVGYEFRKYSSERLSYSNATLTDHFLLLGASLFGYNRLNHYTKIQPAMSVSFIIDNTRLKYKYNNEVESGYHYTYAYGVGLSLIFDVSPKNAFVITPAISIVKNKISFGFELASVFATKESDMMLR